MDNTMDMHTATLAMLTGPPDDLTMSSSDFNYGEFLDQQEADYYGDESSGSNNPLAEMNTQTIDPGAGSQALVPSSRSAGASPTGSSSGGVTQTQRTRLERRGHTKSVSFEIPSILFYCGYSWSFRTSREGASTRETFCRLKMALKRKY